MTYCIAYPPRKPRPFYKETAGEYEKRLGRFCKVRRIDGIGPGKGKDHIILLSPEGARISSEEMADRFSLIESGGVISRVIFMMNKNMPAHPDEVWAFTSVTVPEDLLMVLLLEQIYRAQKIMHHETYHK